VINDVRCICYDAVWLVLNYKILCTSRQRVKIVGKIIHVNNYCIIDLRLTFFPLQLLTRTRAKETTKTSADAWKTLYNIWSRNSAKVWDTRLINCNILRDTNRRRWLFYNDYNYRGNPAVEHHKPGSVLLERISDAFRFSANRRKNSFQRRLQSRSGFYQNRRRQVRFFLNMTVHRYLLYDIIVCIVIVVCPGEMRFSFFSRQLAALKTLRRIVPGYATESSERASIDRVLMIVSELSWKTRKSWN